MRLKSGERAWWLVHELNPRLLKMISHESGSMWAHVVIHERETSSITLHKRHNTWVYNLVYVTLTRVSSKGWQVPFSDFGRYLPTPWRLPHHMDLVRECCSRHISPVYAAEPAFFRQHVTNGTDFRPWPAQFPTAAGSTRDGLSTTATEQLYDVVLVASLSLVSWT